MTNKILLIHNTTLNTLKYLHFLSKMIETSSTFVCPLCFERQPGKKKDKYLGRKWTKTSTSHWRKLKSHPYRVKSHPKTDQVSTHHIAD